MGSKLSSRGRLCLPIRVTGGAGVVSLVLIVGLLSAGTSVALAQSCNLEVSLPVIVPNHTWQPDPTNPNKLNLMMRLSLRNPAGCPSRQFLGLRLTAGGSGDDLAHIDRVSIYLDTNCDGKPDGAEFAGGTYPGNNAPQNFCSIWANPPVLGPNESLCLLVYYDMDECAPAGATFYFTLTSALTTGCNQWAVNSQTYSAVKTVGECCLYVEKHANSPRNHNWTWSATDPVNEMLLLKLSNACCQEQLRLRCLKLRASGTGDDAADIDRIVLFEDLNCNGVLDGGEITIGEYLPYPFDNGDVELCPNYPIDAFATGCLGIGYKMKSTAPCDATYKFDVIDVQVTDATGQTQCRQGDALPISSAVKTVYCPCCLQIYPGPANPTDHSWRPDPANPDALNKMAHIKICNPTGCPQTYIRGLRLRASGTGNDQLDIAGVKLYLDSGCDGVPDSLIGSGVYNANDGAVSICGATMVIPPGQCVCILVYYDMNDQRCPPVGATYRFTVEAVLGMQCEDVCAQPAFTSATKTVSDCCLKIEKHPNSPADHNWTYNPNDEVNEMLLLKVTNECCLTSDMLILESLKLRASGSGDDAADIAGIILWEDVDADGVYDATEWGFASPVYPSDDGETWTTHSYSLPGTLTMYIGIGYVMKSTAPCGATYQFTVEDVVVKKSTGADGCWTGTLPIASAKKTVYCPQCCLEVWPGANPGDHTWYCVPGTPIQPNFMAHLKIYNPCATTQAIFGLKLAAGGTGDELTGVDSVTVRLDTDCDGVPDTGDILSGGYTQDDGTLDLCGAAGPVYLLPPGQFVCLNIYYNMKCAAPEGTYYFDVTEILGSNCAPVCSYGLPLRSVTKTVVTPKDYGDAPDQPYPTLFANDGARHVPGEMILGATIDIEPDGQPDGNATGDDFSDLADEDGVEFLTPLVPGEEAWILVTANGPPAGMYLSAWVDFVADGSWATPGDQIFVAEPLNPGANLLSFTVPATLSGYVETYARFRLHDNPDGIGFTGEWIDGEVEDYLVTIEGPASADLGDAPDSTNSYETSMTAYPPGGPPGVTAMFPTVFQMGSPPFGPIHWNPRGVAYLGDSVSLESEADFGPDQDGVNNLIPTSDQPDLDGSDDGLIFPLLLPHCRPSTFRYVVTVVAPGTYVYANAWFDWNRDGDWDDILSCLQGAAPEWAVQNQLLVFEKPGQYTMTSPSFLPWHLPESTVGPLWMRLTLAERPWQPSGEQGGGGAGPRDGYQIGETEDYYFTPETETTDWGDAPDPTYPTLATNNGANHTIVPGMCLGAAVDGEADGQPNALATGDDWAGDDEDGVVFVTPFIPGLAAQFDVTVSAAGRLDAWIDRDGNGSWADPGEQIFTGYPLSAGTTRLGVTVAGSGGFYTCMRFRFSSAGFLAPTGPAEDGEVEDYRVWVYPRPVEVTKGEAKLLPVGTPVLLKRNTVTANFGSDGWFFEEPDRSSGIGVLTPDGVSSAWGLGDLVSCYGNTVLNGCELMVAEVYSWLEDEPLPLGPLGQTNRASGGGTFGSQPGLMDDVGMAGAPKPATGLNSVGLLVTLWGRCACILSDAGEVQTDFWVDDGSNLWDGMCESYGVRVRIPQDYAESISLERYYSVTGIMRTYTTPGGECVRWLWPRSASDIVPQTEVFPE